MAVAVWITGVATAHAALPVAIAGRTRPAAPPAPAAARLAGHLRRTGPWTPGGYESAPTNGRHYSAVVVSSSSMAGRAVSCAGRRTTSATIAPSVVIRAAAGLS